MTIRNFPASPVAARHSEPSMIFSLDDDGARPDNRLIDLALASIQEARNIDLSHLSARMKGGPDYPNVWPGEHYRLLAGIVKSLQPQVIIEIGTATGLSALALKEFLPPQGILVTFDIIPWNEFKDTVLTPDDFNPHFVQHIGDIAAPSTIIDHHALLQSADLIFIDAAKDGISEAAMISNLDLLTFEKSPILIFDDIRLWNMLKIWRDIVQPKLDITSFGHWSGTGLVHWR